MENHFAPAGVSNAVHFAVCTVTVAGKKCLTIYKAPCACIKAFPHFFPAGVCSSNPRKTLNGNTATDIRCKPHTFVCLLPPLIHFT